MNIIHKCTYINKAKESEIFIGQITGSYGALCYYNSHCREFLVTNKPFLFVSMVTWENASKNIVTERERQRESIPFMAALKRGKI